MLRVLLFFILYILIIAITMPKPAIEGFNTYFRQSVRPHLRNIKEFGLDFEGNTKNLLVRVGRVFGLS
jgi:hypothetical protein